MGLKIISTGSYVPKKRVSNDDLSKLVDTNDEWITSRTGISYRHFASDQDTVELAFLASLKAIETIDKKKIGIIIAASITNPYHTPSIACLIQEKLGLPEDILAFDLNAACSGFVYSCHVAHSLLSASKKPYALIVGAEKLSSIIDFTDRSTCILFGDGAGSAVVAYQKSPFYQITGSQGNLEALYAKEYLSMQGRAVFRFATHVIEKCIIDLLNVSQLDINDIDYFIIHQANKRIIAHVYKKLHIPADKFYTNLQEYGNTSGASIPLALDEMNQKKLLKKGMRLMMIGFGGGLTYGGNIVEW